MYLNLTVFNKVSQLLISVHLKGYSRANQSSILSMALLKNVGSFSTLHVQPYEALRLNLVLLKPS